MLDHLLRRHPASVLALGSLFRHAEQVPISDHERCAAQAARTAAVSSLSTHSRWSASSAMTRNASVSATRRSLGELRNGYRDAQPVGVISAATVSTLVNGCQHFARTLSTRRVRNADDAALQGAMARP
jgi:hypothetical protein